MLDLTLRLSVIDVRLVADDDAAADVRRIVEAMGFLEAPRSDHAPVVRVRCAAALPDVPPGGVLRIQAHASVCGYQVPEGLFLTTPAGRARVGADGGQIVLAQGISPAEVAWLLTTAFHLIARAVGAHEIHAAALDGGGSGVLVVGPSDVGKSTLAVALVGQGWGFVSDDSVLLHDAPEGTVEALPFRRRFGLDADGHFPELDAHAFPQPAEPEKRSVDMAARHAAQARERTVPGLIVFPEIVDAAESRLTAIAPAEAYGRLLAQVATRRLADAHTRAHHAMLGHLMAQAPAVRLAAGRDVLGAPVAVADLLSRALHTAP